MAKAMKFGRKVFAIVKKAYQKGKPVFCNDVCPSASNENVQKACGIVCGLEVEDYRINWRMVRPPIRLSSAEVEDFEDPDAPDMEEVEDFEDPDSPDFMEEVDFKFDTSKAMETGKKVFDIVKKAYAKGKPIFCNNICPSVTNENFLKACEIICTTQEFEETEEFKFNFKKAFAKGKKTAAIVKKAYAKGKPIFCNNVCPSVTSKSVQKACAIVCRAEEEIYEE